MLCSLDLDGVVVDFIKGACLFHKINHANTMLSWPEGLWDFVEVLGMTSSDFWTPLDGDFWANLPRTPEFDSVLDTVEKHFGADNVCILTAPAAHPECPTGKVKWIEKHLPNYRRRYSISAAKAFSAHSNMVLIDDSDKNVQEFRKAGGKAILFPRVWNSNYAMRHDPVAYLKSELKTLDQG